MSFELAYLPALKPATVLNTSSAAPVPPGVTSVVDPVMKSKSRVCPAM